MQETLVYTPATLAERWACSDRQIRLMVQRGDLPAFRLGGKLIRIRREDVEAYEWQNGVSPDYEDNLPSLGSTKMVSEDGISSGLQTGRRRNASPRLDTRSSRARLV